MKYTECQVDVIYKGFYNGNQHYYIFKLKDKDRGCYLYYNKERGNSGYGARGAFSFLDKVEIAPEEDVTWLEQCIKEGKSVQRPAYIINQYQIY